MSRQARPMTDPSDPRHGTTNGYGNLGCRCDPCKSAWSAEQKKQRRRRSEVPFEAKPHGTVTGYANWQCRCDACLIAMGYDPDRRKLWAERRAAIAELASEGKTVREVAERVGITRQEVRRIAGDLNVTLTKPAPKPPTPELEMLAQFRTVDSPEARDERNQLIRTVRGQGFPLRVIGERLGMSHQGVSLIIGAGPLPRCEMCGQPLRHQPGDRP